MLCWNRVHNFSPAFRKTERQGERRLTSTAILWFAGLRGAMSFALVEHIPLYDFVSGEGTRFKPELKAMTSASIMFTVFVLGGYTYYVWVPDAVGSKPTCQCRLIFSFLVLSGRSMDSLGMAPSTRMGASKPSTPDLPDLGSCAAAPQLSKQAAPRQMRAAMAPMKMERSISPPSPARNVIITLFCFPQCPSIGERAEGKKDAGIKVGREEKNDAWLSHWKDWLGDKTLKSWNPHVKIFKASQQI